MDLSIIIVSYNTKDHLADCLRSVYGNHFSGKHEIIVVDNASSDGTRELIKSEFPGITLLSNEKNAGFSVAVNQALRISQGNFILLLNPDTLILPFALDTLAEFMEDHADAGAASPRQWLDPEKNFLTTVTAKPPGVAILFSKIPLVRKFAIKTLHKHIWKEDFEIWKASEPLEVDALNGACLFVRREMIDDVGHLDENFFLFFEDVDWSKRMRNKGWTLYCVPAAEIVHFGMRSVQRAQNIQKISDESRDYYIQKHFGFSRRFPWQLYSFYKKWFSERLRPPKKKKQTLPAGLQKEPRHPGMVGDEIVSLQWEPIKGAPSYVVEISQDPLFLYKGGTIVPTNSLSLMRSLRELWSSGSYFWRVAPVYRDGTLGEYSRPKILHL